MRISTAALVVLAVATLGMSAVLGPQPATAAPDDSARMEELFYAVLESDDPASLVESLSDADRQLWEQTMQVVQVHDEASREQAEAQQGESLLLAGCWTQLKRRVGENFLGYDLWRFHLRINWCENGSIVTLVNQPQVTVDVNYPFWSYSGIVNSTDSGGVGFTQTTAYRQGEFKYCAPEIACAQYQYPWIELTGGLNGYSSWRGGGGSGW